MPKGKRKPFSWQEPWERKPHSRQWEVQGYRAVALKHPVLRHWLLYLGVPKEHPWWGHHHDDLPVHVHGGLSFSGRRVPLMPDAYDGGRMLWWVGVDFGHVWLGDLMPGLIKRNPLLRLGVTYRDLSYVSAEAEKLARVAEKAKQEQAALNE